MKLNDDVQVIYDNAKLGLSISMPKKYSFDDFEKKASALIRKFKEMAKEKDSYRLSIHRDESRCRLCLNQI